MSEIKKAKHTASPFEVAIDYDDTFSSCPETWTKVIDVLREAGARVSCVTFRGKDTPVNDFPGSVYYTNGEPKARFMFDLGITINVWIDDQPELIGGDPYREEFEAA